MGFLLGAFGKLAAGRRVRDLQARMMNVQTRMRRATRQIEKMSKCMESAKKAELNGLTVFQQMSKVGIQQTLINQYGVSGILGQAMGAGTAGASGLTADQQKAYGDYQLAMSQATAMNEMQITQMKQAIEEKYETMNDLLLEPLKMEEDSLQTEKDSLESQIQIAQADYEACKKMEQADAKNLAPNYTGQA